MKGMRLAKQILLGCGLGLLLAHAVAAHDTGNTCLLYTSPSPRDATLSRMPSSA